MISFVTFAYTFRRKLIALSLCGGLAFAPRASTAAQPLIQSSQPEQIALAAARAQTDPQARANALEQFLHTYPRSSELSSAAQDLFETCLHNPPTHLDQLHTAAVILINTLPPGLERWTEEARLALQLADAGEHGIDLNDAALWATSAVHSLTEAAYRQQVLREQARYHLPALSSHEISADFAHDRAAALIALACVRLQQHQLDEVASLLSQVRQLGPATSDLFRLQGQLALAHGQESEALAALIQADARRPLDPAWRTRELTLFQTLRQGDADALDAEVDTAYLAAFPPLYRLAPRHLLLGGHPALLQLFTGSDCLPCAGPDLAIDSLLSTYSPDSLIALEFDLHVPRPDPLATTETTAYASLYNVATTPSAFLDGQPLQILGSSRRDVENIVIGFADQVEDVAALPSGLQLTLTAERTPEGQIRARVHLATTHIAPGTDDTGDTSLRSLQRAEVHLALVQDRLHYPGQNGVRLHRMVVRGLQNGLAASALTQNPLLFTFDPAALDRQNAADLASFEQTNDRFGAFHFATTHIPLDPAHLVLVVWVQDPATHRVLQSTLTPVPGMEERR